MHTCSSILFICIDFRLMKQTFRFLESKGLLGDTDVVSLAGAGRKIASGSPEERELMLEQISISQKLHHSQTVILLHHSDCGAYKSVYQFANDDEEKAKQLEDMRAAARLIESEFPKTTVVKIWAKMLDSEGKEVEFSEID